MSHPKPSFPHHQLKPTDSQLPFSRPPTPHDIPLKVGFYGLGNMGYLMARNLANHQRPDLPPVLVYNRTVSKSQSLESELGPKKIIIAQSPEQLVHECDVIITSLSNDNVIKEVYQQFAAALQGFSFHRRKIFVETSTIYFTTAGELDNIISGPHTSFITSPVFGAPPAADKAQLVIVMSGEVRAKREAAYILVPAVGRKVIDVGSNVETAPKLKVIGNSLIVGSIEIMGEAMTLASKAGVGAENVANLIKDLLPSPSWLLYSDKILHDKFDGTNGFNLEGGIKDTRHIRSLAADYNSPMPVIDIAHQHMLTARAVHQAQGENAKHQTLDWSSVVAGSRLAAGLDPFDHNKGEHRPEPEP